jgi:hypothetical protein
MTRLRLSIAVGAALYTTAVLGQDVTRQHPVDQGVPIGCLLSEKCRHPLLKVVAAAPIDEGKGFVCFFDASCVSASKPAGNSVHFERAVTIEQVAERGATSGDFIPTKSSRLSPPSAPLDATELTERCDKSVSVAQQASNQVQVVSEASSKWESKHAALMRLERSYTMAVNACVPPQQRN